MAPSSQPTSPCIADRTVRTITNVLVTHGWPLRRCLQYRLSLRRRRSQRGRLRYSSRRTQEAKAVRTMRYRSEGVPPPSIVLLSCGCFHESDGLNKNTKQDTGKGGSGCTRRKLFLHRAPSPETRQERRPSRLKKRHALEEYVNSSNTLMLSLTTKPKPGYTPRQRGNLSRISYASVQTTATTQTTAARVFPPANHGSASPD